MALTKSNKPVFIILALVGLIISLLIVVSVGIPNLRAALASPYGSLSNVAANPTFAPASTSSTGSANTLVNVASTPIPSAATPVTTPLPTTSTSSLAASGSCTPITIVEMDPSNRQAFDASNEAVLNASSYAVKMNLQVDIVVGAENANLIIAVDGFIDGFDAATIDNIVINLDLLVNGTMNSGGTSQSLPPIEATIRMVDNAYYFHAPLIDAQLSQDGQEIWLKSTQEELLGNAIPFSPVPLDVSNMSSSFSLPAIPGVLELFTIERFVHTELVGPDGERTHYRSVVDLCEFLKSPEFRAMAQTVATLGGLPALDVSDFQASSTSALPDLSLVIDLYTRAGALSNLNLDFRTLLFMDPQSVDVKTRIQVELSQLNATFQVETPTNTMPLSQLMATLAPASAP